MRPEDEFQATVAEWLTVKLPSTAWFTALSNGAFLGGGKSRRVIQANRLKKTGVKNGCPDIILCHEGRFFGIELKTPQGKLSKSQEATSEAIVAAGGGYTVARSIEAVEAFLRENGVIT